MISVWELRLLCTHKQTHSQRLSHACTHIHKESDRHTGENSAPCGLLSQAFKQKRGKICFYSADCEFCFLTISLCSSDANVSVINMQDKQFSACCTRTKQLMANYNFWNYIVGRRYCYICQSGEHKAIQRECLSEWLKKPQGAAERGREFVREYLSVVQWWLFSSNLSAN